MSDYTDQRKIEKSAQQAYRFYLKIDDLYSAFIVNVARPSYTIGIKEYKLLNHYIKHPVDIKWNDVSFSIREIFAQDTTNSVGGTLMTKLTQDVYAPPNKVDRNNLKDLSKRGLMNALGVVEIQMLTPEGEVYESWKLQGAFIKDVKFSQLDYSSDALTNIDVTLSYDWAELTFNPKR
jgi:hypothetical protein